MRFVLLAALLACHREPSERPPEAKPAAAAAAPVVDLPSLPDERGTLPVDRGRTITITTTRVSIEGVGDFDPAKPDEILERLRSANLPPDATLLAIDRTVTMHTFDELYDRVFHAGGAGELELLVTAPKQTRMVIVENAKVLAPAEDVTYSIITVGAGLWLRDRPVTLDELRAEIAKSPSDRVLVVTDADVTVQRLAEVIAAIGGHARLGNGILRKQVPAPHATHVQPAVPTPAPKVRAATAGTPSYDPPEAWTRCAHDEECTVTGTQCGNHDFPINKQHAADAKAAVAQLCKGHPDVVMMSIMPKPRCTEGHCEDANRPRSGGLKLP